MRPHVIVSVPNADRATVQSTPVSISAITPMSVRIRLVCIELNGSSAPNARLM